MSPFGFVAVEVPDVWPVGRDSVMRTADTIACKKLSELGSRFHRGDFFVTFCVTHHLIHSNTVIERGIAIGADDKSTSDIATRLAVARVADAGLTKRGHTPTDIQQSFGEGGD